jgi:GAF domain-containing protein
MEEAGMSAPAGNVPEIEQRLAFHREELAEQLREALEATLFSHRPFTRSLLKQIAAEEADVFLAFLKHGDTSAARAQGARQAREGLGMQGVLRMRANLRLFCHAHLEGQGLAAALSAADIYTDAILEGFAEAREAIVLDEQERIRAAMQRALGRYTLQLQTVAEIARATSSILDLNELMSTSVDLIRERLDLYYAGIFLVDDYGEWAVLRAATGDPGQEMLHRGHKLKVGGQSMIGWCVDHGQPRIALDVGKEAVRFDNPLLPETHSELALPLIIRGRIIGAMTIQSGRVAAFSNEDITTLRILTDQLANAIENARLLAQAQAHLEEIQAIQSLYTRRVYTEEALSGLAGYRYELSTDTFVPADDLWRPEVEGAAHEDRPGILTTHASPLAPAALSVPITLHDQAIGTLDLYDLAEPRRWSDDEITLTTAVVSQAALAIENARLFQETQRRATQLATAAAVARDATAILDVDHLLDETMSLISKQFGFYHAGIFLLDERDEYAVLQAASSEGGRRMLERGHKLRVGEVGIVGYVASTGEPRVALDVGEDTAHFAHPDLPNTRSEMALPLKVQDRVIGVLDVQSTQEAAFSEDDVAVLQTMADQLATAIANARLFEQVQRRARRERLIREITAHIRSAVDVESILQTTVQELGKALGTSHGLARLGTEMELGTPLVKGAGDAEAK